MKEKTICRSAFGLILVMALGLGLTAGCGKKEEGGLVVYYLNLPSQAAGSENSSTKLVGETTDLDPAGQNLSTDLLLGQVVELLCTASESGDLRRTIPEDLKPVNVYMTGSTAVLDFPEEYLDYQEKSPAEEVLTRAGAVKTLVQLDAVDNVLFLVKGAALTDHSGNYIGKMNEDSFVENAGQQINSSQTTEIVLYFASDNGKGLVRQTRKVTHSSNISLEKLVMEQLILGPESGRGKATVPSTTNLINVTVADGICYVNLDEALTNAQDSDISEEVILYSIVDSLCQLEDVDKVQISVNGESKGYLRNTLSLDAIYEANESLVMDALSESVTEASDTVFPEVGTESEEPYR